MSSETAPPSSISRPGFRQFAWAGIVLALGMWVFNKFSARVVEEL